MRRLKFKLTTVGINYGVNDNYRNICINLFNIVLLIILAYCCNKAIVTLNMLLFVFVISFSLYLINIIRQLLIQFIVWWLETLPDLESKRLFLRRLVKFYYRSNPLVYYTVKYTEIFVKIRRNLFSILPSYKSKVVFMNLFSFFIYYPCTRLCVFWIKFWGNLYMTDLYNILFVRLQSYVLFTLIISPLIFNFYGSYVKWWHVLLFYYLLLLLLVPILNAARGLYYDLLFNRLQVKLDPLLSIAAHSIEKRKQLYLNVNELYPSIAYIIEKRKRMNIFSLVLFYYSDYIVEAQKLHFRKHNIIVRVPTWEEFFSYSLGTFNPRVDVWRYVYLRPLIKYYDAFYYLENNKYISYYWYENLYYQIMHNWTISYSMQFLYEKALNMKLDIDQDFFQFFKNNMLMSNELLATQLKAIWDIEKDWGIDPLDLHPEIRKYLLAKGRDYPIYEDACSILFCVDDCNNLKIKPQVYQTILHDKTTKIFNCVLEERLVHLVLDTHIKSWFVADFLDNYGKYLVEDLKPSNIDPLQNEIINIASVLLDFKKKKYDIIIRDVEDLYDLRTYRSKRLGQDVARWRQEWKERSNNEI